MKYTLTALLIASLSSSVLADVTLTKRFILKSENFLPIIHYVAPWFVVHQQPTMDSSTLMVFDVNGNAIDSENYPSHPRYTAVTEQTVVWSYNNTLLSGELRAGTLDKLIETYHPYEETPKGLLTAPDGKFILFGNGLFNVTTQQWNRVAEPYNGVVAEFSKNNLLVNQANATYGSVSSPCIDNYQLNDTLSKTSVCLNQKPFDRIFSIDEVDNNHVLVRYLGPSTGKTEPIMYHCLLDYHHMAFSHCGSGNWVWLSVSGNRFVEHEGDKWAIYQRQPKKLIAEGSVGERHHSIDRMNQQIIDLTESHLIITDIITAKTTSIALPERDSATYVPGIRSTLGWLVIKKDETLVFYEITP